MIDLKQGRATDLRGQTRIGKADGSAGKRSAIEAWTGAVVRLGKEMGVVTPVNEFIYCSLLPGEMSARGVATTD